MGTRSTIGVVNADGTVTGIYCHWDGYPDHNGRILRNHYTTPDKIIKLMKLGDLSVLGPEIGRKHAFSPFEVPDSERVAFEIKTEGWCTAYGRDRGEEGTKAQKYKDIFEFLADDRGQAYSYVYVNNKWECRNYNKDLVDIPA